jgi:hypothetical protein
MTIYSQPKTQTSSKYVSFISKFERPKFAQLDPPRNASASMLTFALKAPWELQFCSVNTKTIKKHQENIANPIADTSSHMCIFSTICRRRSNTAKQMEINQHDHIETSKNIKIFKIYKDFH